MNAQPSSICSEKSASDITGMGVRREGRGQEEQMGAGDEEGETEPRVPQTLLRSTTCEFAHSATPATSSVFYFVFVFHVQGGVNGFRMSAIKVVLFRC